MVPVPAEKVPPDEVGGTRTGLRPKRSAPDEVGCRARTESRNRISAELGPRTMRLVARTAPTLEKRSGWRRRSGVGVGRRDLRGQLVPRRSGVGLGDMS
eukprot:scaffold120714_cov69-Phaeocystis_antarctica.AAC.1